MWGPNPIRNPNHGGPWLWRPWLAMGLWLWQPLAMVGRHLLIEGFECDGVGKLAIFVRNSVR